MKMNILAIDNQPIVLESLKQVLEDKSTNVLTALSGEEGLEIVDTETIHLFILDIQMPDFTGLEVCKRLKKDDRTKNIPVVFLSADFRNEEQALAVGAEKFIIKPFEVKDLRELINGYRKKIMPSTPPA